MDRAPCLDSIGILELRPQSELHSRIESVLTMPITAEQRLDTVMLVSKADDFPFT